MGLFGRGFIAGAVEPFLDEVKRGKDRADTATATTVGILQDVTLPSIVDAENKADEYYAIAKNLNGLGLDKENIMAVIDRGPDAIKELYTNINKINKERLDKGLILEKAALNKMVRDTRQFSEYDSKQRNTSLKDYIKKKYTPNIDKIASSPNPDVTFLDTLFGWDSEAASNKELDKIIFRETVDADGNPIKITALDLKRLTRTGDQYGYNPEDASGDQVTIDYAPIMEGLVASDREKIITTLSTKALSELPSVKPRSAAVGNTFEKYENNAVYQYFLARNYQTHDEATALRIDDPTSSIKQLNDFKAEIEDIDRVYETKNEKIDAMQSLTNRILYSEANSENGFPNETIAKAFLNMFRTAPNIYSAFNADDTVRVNGVDMNVATLAPYLFE